MDKNKWGPYAWHLLHRVSIQNKEIIKLIQANVQHGEILLQHIEILKYLVEQDPQLGKTRMHYGGVVGEA